jgi:hypothetical protein
VNAPKIPHDGSQYIVSANVVENPMPWTYNAKLDSLVSGPDRLENLTARGFRTGRRAAILSMRKANICLVSLAIDMIADFQF